MGGEVEIAVILQGSLPHLGLIGLYPQKHVWKSGLYSP